MQINKLIRTNYFWLELPYPLNPKCTLFEFIFAKHIQRVWKHNYCLSLFRQFIYSYSSIHQYLSLPRASKRIPMYTTAHIQTPLSALLSQLGVILTAKTPLASTSLHYLCSCFWTYFCRSFIWGFAKMKTQILSSD